MLTSEIQLNPLLGQVWTPSNIAQEMALGIASFLDDDSIILDPACGPGTFYQAARNVGLKYKSFKSFDVDARLINWLRNQLTDKSHEIILGDFLTYNHEEANYDAVIINPPYIRHEQIEPKVKTSISNLIREKTGYVFTSRINYFGYFLILGSVLLKQNGVMVAIVYDSLDNTKYGNELLEYLSSQGTFLSRKKVSAPFQDRMIDAEIILWKKENKFEVQPLELIFESTETPAGYCFVSELGKVKRGTSFLKRQYYVEKDPEIPEFYTPMITKQSITSGLLVESNAFGILSTGNEQKDLINLQKVNNSRHLDGLQSVTSLPLPVYGDILFNYYIRDNARHLLNINNIPASDNFYCFTPFNADLRIVHWVLSNSSQYVKNLISASRTQGSGLRKLQLFEYAKSHFPDYRLFSQEIVKDINDLGQTAIQEKWPLQKLIAVSTSKLNSLGLNYE